MTNLKQGRAAAWTLFSLLWTMALACGGSSTPEPVSVPPGDSPVVAEQATRPPVPEDLWAIVPADAMLVADLDVAQLRQWSHYPTLRRWLSQYACVQDGARTQFIDRVHRAVAAVTLRGERDLDGLLLLRGAFTDADAMAIAAEIDPRLQKQERGRWTVYADPNDVVALLDERTMLIAAGAWGDEALKLAGSVNVQSVRTASFVQDLTPRLTGESNLFVAMAKPSGGIVQDVLRDIERWGGSAKVIAKGLAGAPYWGARIRLDGDSAGVNASGVAAGGSEANAAELIEGLRTAFWQAGLFMRLIGLPPILTNATLEQAAGVATLGLHATGSEAGVLLGRLEDVIKGEADACEPAAAIATSPSP